MQRATCECCGEPLALPPAQPAQSQIEAREWNGHPIQRRQIDGYVNATAVCQANHKRWNDYARLERTEAYIAALAADAGFPATGLVVSIKGGRPELAAKEKAEIEVLAAYLPKQLSAEELTALVKEAIAEAGATSKAQMGAVMKVASAKAAGRVDGKALNQEVQKQLPA
jgi:hypothetical protein